MQGCIILQKCTSATQNTSAGHRLRTPGLYYFILSCILSGIRFNCSKTNNYIFYVLLFATGSSPCNLYFSFIQANKTIHIPDFVSPFNIAVIILMLGYILLYAYWSSSSTRKTYSVTVCHDIRLWCLDYDTR
jgi:hypothetical protein